MACGSAVPHTESWGCKACSIQINWWRFGEDEMKWPLLRRFHLGATLARGLAAGPVNEVRHTRARLRGRYDIRRTKGNAPRLR